MYVFVHTVFKGISTFYNNIIIQRRYVRLHLLIGGMTYPRHVRTFEM